MVKPIEIDPPDAGRVRWERLDGVLIQGQEPAAVTQGYWETGQGPDTEFDPETREFKIHVIKTWQRIRFVEESETEVTIIVEAIPVKDAPDTGKLPPQPRFGDDRFA